MSIPRRPATPTLLLALALALALVVGAAACGDDEDDAGTATGQQESTEGTADEDDGEAAGDDPHDAGVGADAYGSECRPVGEDLAPEATETVAIELDDYAFLPPELEVPAGIVTFSTSNVGEEAHELAFLPGGGDVPFTDDGAPDEEALGEMDAFELEAYPPGGSCDATYQLEPGEYTLFCIVEAEDGETHYEKGMRGTLTVR